MSSPNWISRLRLDGFTTFPGVSTRELEAAEELIGCSLPRDYRDFMMYSNGLWYGEHEEPSVGLTLSPIGKRWPPPHNRKHTVEELNAPPLPEHIAHIVAIGSDLTGEDICFQRQDLGDVVSAPVYVWYHEEYRLERIHDSFKLLMERLRDYVPPPELGVKARLKKAWNRRRRRKIVKGLMKEARQLLFDRGFRKHSKGTASFSCPITKETRGTIVLSTVFKAWPPEFEIDVPVGICHLNTEWVFDTIMGIPHDPGLFSTAFHQLGYLMPENDYRSWFFSDDEEANRRALEDLMSSIDQYAIPFLKQNASLEAIYKRIDAPERPLVCYFKPYRFPIMLHLLDRMDEAHSIVDRRLEEVRDETYPEADQYRQFAEGVKHWMRTGEARRTVEPFKGW